MSNLIEDIARANDDLRQVEDETSEAGFRLQDCKRRFRQARAELDTLITELATNKSRYPLFERIDVSPNGTYDEPTPQAGFPPRGPTEFPTSTVSLGPRQWTPARAAGLGSAPGAKARKAAK
jgi:hypothetical protein